jgi:hypothetical protein
MKGEDFRIRMRGKMLIQNNRFEKIEKGEFIGINVEELIIKREGIKVMMFEKNNIRNFEKGCLMLNVKSFENKIERIIIKNN